jgi:glycerol-3-phosphate O-acyltransferase / dihydroxyacetone phosphate acyltransferase
VATLALPLFAYGAAVNALPYLVPRWLARRLARKETDYATVRLLASIVAFPLFWTLEMWLVWRGAGAGWALAFALTLPVSGLIAYHYWVGIGRLRSRLRFAALATSHRQAAGRLLAERRAIIGELEQARADYVKATATSALG